MSGSIVELLLSCGFGIVISAFVFLWTWRSLVKNNEEKFLPQENVKPKKIVTKQPLKTKVVKKEMKPKIVIKEEQKPLSIPTAESIIKPQDIVKKPVDSAQMSENISPDSSTEWTKVTKTAKKTKKDINQEPDNSQSNGDVKTKANAKLDTVKEEIAKKSEVTQAASESVKEVAVQKKVKEKSVDQENNTKSKKVVTVDEEKPKKVTVVEASQKIVESGEKEQLKVDEMMKEMDKMKSNEKEKEIKSNSQNNKEIEALKLKLTKFEKNEEKLLEDLKKKGQAVTDLKNQFLIIQSELTRNIVSSQSLNRDKLNLEDRLRGLEEQSMFMDEKCKLYDQLKVEHSVLEENLAAVENELQNVKHDSMEMLRSRELELSMQINLLQSEKQRLQEQLLCVQNDFIENNNKIQLYQEELLSEKSINADLMSENIRLQQSCADLTQSSLILKEQLTSDFDKSKEYEDQISFLKKQIQDINNKNVVLSQEKSTLQNEIDQLKNVQIIENGSQINELTDNLQTLRQQMEIIEERLLADQVELDESKSFNENQRRQIEELTEEKDNLISLVEQYKAGLESTESILSKLQMSVNEEEQKWRESLTKSENEAEKSKKELESVYNDLMRIRNSRADKNELNFAYHCVDKSLSSLMDEMEARMIHFENSLETLVQERDNALAQISSQQVNGGLPAERHDENCSETAADNNNHHHQHNNLDLSDNQMIDDEIQYNKNNGLEENNLVDVVNGNQTHFISESEERKNSLKSISVECSVNGESALNLEASS